MPGKLIVGTVETQNINYDSDTAGLTIGNTGNITMHGHGHASSGMIHSGWELIQSKMSTDHDQHANGSVIEFRNVFSSDYMKYKVIIGWYLHAGNSGENIEFRFMSGTNTQFTSSSYRYHVTRQGDDNGVTSYKSTSATKGVLYTTIGGETNGANGGQQGELDIINVGPCTLGGVSTQRYYSDDTTPVYAPIVHGTITGYSISGSEYERQDSFIRLNSAQEPYYFTGFCFLTPASGEAKGTHIAVYGWRSA